MIRLIGLIAGRIMDGLFVQEFAVQNAPPYVDPIITFTPLLHCA